MDCIGGIKEGWSGRGGVEVYQLHRLLFLPGSRGCKAWKSLFCFLETLPILYVEAAQDISGAEHDPIWCPHSSHCCPSTTP